MIETYVVPDFVAFTLGMVVYFVGARFTRRVAFLRDYNIPEPVSGGLAVALIIWAVYAIGKVEIEFELDARDTLLVIFFTTIGLNARFADLVRGGKPLGILLFVGLAVGLRIVKLPGNVNWMQIFGVACACGIGFTMSLFIAGLAFEHGSGDYFAGDRLGILLGSLLSALIAYVVLHIRLPPAASDAKDQQAPG